MRKIPQVRLLRERAISRLDMPSSPAARAAPARPARSVTVNLAESPLGWPARAGKLVLGLALDRLVLYYRMG
jgi:hypothetical protein